MAMKSKTVKRDASRKSMEDGIPSEQIDSLCDGFCHFMTVCDAMMAKAIAEIR